MEGIKFNSEHHTYRNRRTDKKYLSTTTFIGMFKQPFDKVFWSLYKAIQYHIGISDARKDEYSRVLKKYYGHNWKNPKLVTLFRFCQDRGIDVNKLKSSAGDISLLWEEFSKGASVKGNNFHDKKEAEAYITGEMNMGADDTMRDTVMEQYFDMRDITDGYHPELRLYNHEYELAGTADKVFVETIKGIKYFDIDDWKTNGVIKETGLQKMKEPLGHLDDCNMIHYFLQSNMYSWMLEQAGFVRRKTEFTHVVVDDNNEVIGNPAIYTVPYMMREINMMLEIRKRYLENAA